MSRNLILIVIGVLIVLSPFSGLPMSILTWILPLLGLVVLATGISYRRERTRSAPSHEASSSTSS